MLKVLLLGSLLLIYLYKLHSSHARRKPYHGPPIVTSTLPWIGTAIELGRDSFAFLQRCRERYGPTYRFFVRGTSITVICNDEGIKDTFRDKARAFSTYTGHRLALRVVGAVKDDAKVVHLMNDRLFPIVARGFGSTSGMAHLTPPLNDTLFNLLSDLADNLGSSSQDKPLTSFLGHILYKASSKTLFGDLFPTDSYTDFEIVDENFFLLISPLPFVARHVIQARTRLLKAIGTYFQVAWKDSHVEGAAPVVSEIVSAIKAADLTLTDEAGLFLNFVWGVRSNSVRSASWLFAHLLTNQDAFTRVREEIDDVLESQFSSDLGALLNAHHSTFGPHNFPLLDSAIKETLRLAVLYGSLREARRDIEVEYGSGKKAHFGVGDLLLPNLGTLHHDSEAFEDAGTFRVDRYLSTEKGGPIFWGFGGGTHVLVDEAGYAPQGKLKPDTRSAGVSRLGGKYSLRVSRRGAPPA